MYTIREGKRLFPLITALGLASAGTAAMSMRYVVGMLRAENIFVVIGALMLTASLVLASMKKIKKPVKTLEQDDVGFKNYLVANLKEGELHLSRHSIEALAKLKSREAVESLAVMLKDCDEKNRLFAAHLLHKIGTPDALKKVEHLVTDDSAEIKVLALRAIKDMKDREFLNDVVSLVRHDKQSVRLAALEAFTDGCFYSMELS